MKIRPSSLPALAQCQAFESDPSGSEYTTDGTKRHEALSKMLAGNAEVLESIEDEDQREGVVWALDFIKLRAPMEEFPLVTESKSSFTGPDFEEISGTPDVVCGPVVFDLKWRWDDYSAQMAAYALMNPFIDDGVTVHVLFANDQKVKTYQFNRQTAEEMVFGIIDRAKSDATPSPCEFCGWCAKKTTCRAVVDRVNAVIENREDFNLETWHSSEITSADEMGKALRVAKVVKEWCESVEHHAKEMATKQGIIPTGFKLQTKKGNRFVASLTDAFAKSGLPQDRFLNACEVKLSRLVEVYAEANGMKQKPAEREIEAKLGEVIQRKRSTQSLVKE